MKRAQGFTLIEVLIALVILATALTLGVGSVQRTARTLGALEQRLLAHWTAENAAVEEQLRAASATNDENAPGEPVTRRTTVTQYGTAFVVASRYTPGATGTPGALRVEVAAQAQPQRALVSLELPMPARP
ncbi:MAG: type II secretion system minor pseudopilin GspI [Gammaproteobacteria bacterium]|nr:type II secretion system minor pseudopilin GspI [Gammaproteobacteria bacterium]